jgi:TonB family protein
MNVYGLFAACLLLFAQAPGLNPPNTTAETAPLRVFRDATPGLVKPVYLEGPNLTYTPEEFKAGVQGAIALDVTVGSDGRVRDAMVTDGATLPPSMDERAIAVLAGWRFQPATLNGQPVAVRITISFTMSRR